MLRLEAERLAKGWSKAELARRANMNAASVIEATNGRRVPGAVQLEKLTQALRLAPHPFEGTPAELLADVPDPGARHLRPIERVRDMGTESTLLMRADDDLLIETRDTLGTLLPELVMRSDDGPFLVLSLSEMEPEAASKLADEIAEQVTTWANRVSGVFRRERERLAHNAAIANQHDCGIAPAVCEHVRGISTGQTCERVGECIALVKGA